MKVHAVDMGGMCSGLVCYFFFCFICIIITVWMFKWYGNYIQMLDMCTLWLICFVVGQVMDICGRTC
ncbi:SNAP25 homologous protein SNAP33-like [Iris pallida]|uniref:SNAP25 homologous protein SNAP33-like n=1 Tax=Iris pallida TaxID=29817 RepID=A0AAX6HAV8_IRIPA|nr:SNAP25 homologous protein SNAP33-like [Iris pallida]